MYFSDEELAVLEDQLIVQIQGGENDAGDPGSIIGADARLAESGVALIGQQNS